MQRRNASEDKIYSLFPPASIFLCAFLLLMLGQLALRALSTALPLVRTLLAIISAGTMITSCQVCCNSTSILMP